MIRKLNQVKGFGLFRDFSWGTLQEFKRYNLIYGWNYSGKTTLSRIFQALEHGAILPEFFGCEFQATLEDGSILGTKALTPYSKVRVFNRPFVESNFSAGMTGAKMIVVVGAENKKLKDRLGQLQTRQAKMLQIKERFESNAKNVDDDLKNKATIQGTVVSTLFGDRSYDRRHLLAEVRALPDDCSSLILIEADHDKLVEEWRRAGDYKKLNAISWPIGSFLKSIPRIRRVLQMTASYKAIERLKQNSKIETWVRDGLALNSAQQPCEFCGSKISDARWAELQEHFSKAYQELHSTVKSLLGIVAGVKCEVAFHDDGVFFSDLSQQYLDARNDSVAALTALKGQLDELSAALKEKSENLESVHILKIDWFTAKQLRAAIRLCNSIIATHNNKVASAGTVREEARVKLTKHYAAKYFVDENCKTKNENIKQFKESVTKAQACINRIIGITTLVQNAIKAASIAANKINDRLKILLSGDNIEAVKVSDTDFEFHRGGQPATNMSEGERTAVALSYFLAKLEEGGTSLSDLTIVLDDPICSFDSNHVYAVYSIVERNLSAAKQLIILTHNADFFGLIKDWMKKQSPSFYMVNRLLDAGQNWYSNIIPLPRLLSKFKSDYLYTYHCLKSIDDKTELSLEEMCGVPNMVRRLLEVYLGFHYPNSDKPAWHGKLDRLFDDEIKCGEIQKFADDLSHVHYLHRAMEVPDYVQHCKRIIRDVLSALKAKDPDHIASLEAELNS